MIDLKDLVFFTLTEGILDDIDDQLETGNNEMNDLQLQDWAAAARNSSKPYWRKTKKGYVIKGNFKINNIEDTYTGPLIKQVFGNIAITNSELESLEGIFTPDCEITGTLTIDNNSKLTSLNGCPCKVGSLTISNNKSLKKIDLTPVVMNNAYIAGNGKRFKKEDLEKEMQVGKHIFCSVENDANILEANIMEAFKAPQLKLITDTIKNISRSVRNRDDKAQLDDIRSIKWDQIEPSDIAEYDIEDAECLKMCRKVFSSSDFSGIIVCLNKNGEVVYIITGKSGIVDLDQYRRNSFLELNKWNIRRTNYAHRTSDLIDIIKRRADTVLIIDTTEANDGWSGKPEGKYSTRTQKWQRENSRKGSIAYQRETEREYTTAEIESNNGKLLRYYNDIARDNIKRYKRILEEIRAKRELEANNRFESINDRIDKCLERYMKLVKVIAANPTKYEKLKYELNSLHTQLTYHSYSNSSEGLLSLLTEYLRLLTDKDKYVGDNRSEFDKMYNDPKSFTKKLNALETAMENRLISVENILKTFEAVK